MFQRIRYLGPPLLAAALTFLGSFVPAAAQGAYPGSATGYGSAAMPVAAPPVSAPRYTTASTAPGASAVPRGARIYTVRFGDTLSKISARFGVSIAALLQANPAIFDPDLIFAGQRLVIPSRAARTEGSQLYIIRFGDTLRKIAVRFGVSISALLRANPSIVNPDRIFAGRVLVIPARRAVSFAPSGYAAPPSTDSSGSGAYLQPMASMPGQPMASSMSAVPAPPAPPTQPSPQPAGQAVTVDLTAHNMAFDRSSIAVPAGAHVTVHFTNMDAMPHNFAVYTDSSAGQAIFQGPTVMGPNATTTYEFDAPAQRGTYFFRCDVHPTVMNGQFVVQ